MDYSAAVAVVKKALERNVNGLEVSDDDMDVLLKDLGVDSIDVMMVIMDIVESAGVSVSDDQAVELDTPAKIVSFLMR